MSLDVPRPDQKAGRVSGQVSNFQTRCPFRCPEERIPKGVSPVQVSPDNGNDLHIMAAPFSIPW